MEKGRSSVKICTAQHESGAESWLRKLKDFAVGAFCVFQVGWVATHPVAPLLGLPMASQGHLVLGCWLLTPPLC